MWSIYDAATLKIIADFDGIAEFEGDNSSTVTRYPTERGGFTSVNKVSEPARVSLKLLKGGTDEDRDAAIKSLKSYERSTKLINIVSPSFSYMNLNITSFSHAHSSREGANLLIANLKCEEIRQTVASYDNISVTNPNFSGTIDSGKVTAKKYDGLLYRKTKGAA